MPADSTPNPFFAQIRSALLAELDRLPPEELGGRSPRAIAEWLLDSASLTPPDAGAPVSGHPEHLDLRLTIVATHQELARRLWYIGRVRAADRSSEWDVRLLWDFTSAIVRDLHETTAALVALTAQGTDAPAKVLLRHAMELYGRALVVLRDPKEQRAYLAQLQQLRDFQLAGRDEDGVTADYRSIGLVGGALMDRVAIIEQNLDSSSLPSREQAHATAALLRDLYTYFSNLTHGGPELVDDVLYVYDPSFPSGQRRRAWGFGKPTSDGDLTLQYLTMLLWQFWRLVPRALERSGLAHAEQGDTGMLLVASRGLERAIVGSFGSQLFSAGDAPGT